MTLAHLGFAIVIAGATASADHNWWGCNTGPSGSSCDSVGSSGAVTMAAIVSGLAPGRRVTICMVGKSTCGSAETGKRQ